MNPQQHCCDTLIIGAGLAGLSVALSLPKHGRVIILAKDDLAHCASSLAQGGIAAVMDANDSLDAHVADTLRAGDGVCLPTPVRHILSAGAAAIYWLQSWQVPFSTQADGQLRLTREGGHSHRRVVHHADHTGLSITQTLQQHLQQQPHIRVLTRLRIQALQLQHGRCCGASGVDETGQAWQIHADNVVLATGGLGQLFALTTNPLTATGDGIALAAQAGCRIRHLAYVQFHPTALALPQNPCFLISEAVRGEGGILKNHVGERFMPTYDARAELAPRDVVARAIANEIRHSPQPSVYLDVSHLQDAWIRQHFPTIAQHCWQQHQLDICTTPIPVAPAAHYACGGIVTDAQGRTDVAHLYAVGEVSSTGLHGANRLASNSLLECVVMGQAVATAIAHPTPWPAPMAVTAADAYSWAQIAAAIAAQTDAVDGDSLFTLAKLQQAMSAQFGIVRRFEDMVHLWQQLCCWYQHLPTKSSHDAHILMVALLMVHSGLRLERNQGAHFNADLATELSAHAL